MQAVFMFRLAQRYRGLQVALFTCKLVPRRLGQVLTPPLLRDQAELELVEPCRFLLALVP